MRLCDDCGNIRHNVHNENFVLVASFDSGAETTGCRKLMQNTDRHTILRLPSGIFYSGGVKANVLFFDNHEASKTPWTKEVHRA